MYGYLRVQFYVYHFWELGRKNWNSKVQPKSSEHNSEDNILSLLEYVSNFIAHMSKNAVIFEKNLYQIKLGFLI